MRTLLLTVACLLLHPAICVAQNVGDIVVIVSKQPTELRSGADVVTTIPRGAHLAVQQIDNPWYRVSSGASEGWIHRSHALGLNAGLRYFDNEVRRNPTLGDRFHRGNLRLRLGLLDGAIADYNEVIRRAPRQADAYQNRARAWHHLGDYQQAMAGYDQAIQRDAALASAYHNRARLWRQLNDDARAIDDFTRAIEWAPDTAQAYFERGVAKFAMLQYDAAVLDLTRALRRQPGMPNAYLYRGLAWERQGEDQIAIADYTDVVDGRRARVRYAAPSALAYGAPHVVTTRDYLANNESADFASPVHLPMSDEVSANQTVGGLTGLTWFDPIRQSAISRATQQFVDDVQSSAIRSAAYANRGRVYGRQERYVESTEDLSNAMRLLPGLPLLHRLRGTAWREVFDPVSAMADYDEAIRLDPLNVANYHQRGIGWRRQGEFDRAVADFRRAIQLDPDSSYGYDGLAWIQATSPHPDFRDSDEAVKNATAACERTNWNNVSCLRTLAAAYAAARDYPTAARWQAEALARASASQKAEDQLRLGLYQTKRPYRESIPQTSDGAGR